MGKLSSLAFLAVMCLTGIALTQAGGYMMGGKMMPMAYGQQGGGGGYGFGGGSGGGGFGGGGIFGMIIFRKFLFERCCYFNCIVILFWVLNKRLTFSIRLEPMLPTLRFSLVAA
jgi:hypothetical protein